MVNSKRKGSQFERDVKKKLIELLEATDLDDWFMVNRAANYEAGEDVSIISKATGNVVLAFECKCGKAPNIPAAMEQAAQNDSMPVVVSRKDRTGVLVTMRFEDWCCSALVHYLKAISPVRKELYGCNLK